MTYKAVNWNQNNDGYTLVFWEQFIKQFWVDKEVGIDKDKKHWAKMSEDEKEVFKKVLGGLTLLDTQQSIVGAPALIEGVEDMQRKAVLSFMGMMEAIHAKSYSTIFTTLLGKFENDEVFEWVEENQYLQYKVDRILNYYKDANKSQYCLYLAMAASVYLESYLFYSGFFYPLWLAGNGRMMASADIIDLIIRDESIHGVYIGLLAQETYSKLTPEEQEKADQETAKLLEDLMENEIKYTYEIYGKINLISDVVDFIKYNANKALMNLGKSALYPDVEINPIVAAGLVTSTKIHDFFSKKGSGYIKANIEELRDEDFGWED